MTSFLENFVFSPKIIRCVLTQMKVILIEIHWGLYMNKYKIVWRQFYARFLSLFQPDLYTGSRRLLFKNNSFPCSRAPITANRMTTTECRANEILNRWCEFICEQRWHTIVPRTSYRKRSLAIAFFTSLPPERDPTPSKHWQETTRSS